MATYVISDIHGQYDMFMELVDKIKLKETDTLYILGDILDRGPHPIKTLRKLMEMPRPGYIYRKNNHIAIDCGANYPGGRLAALCLDTGTEYYSTSAVNVKR